MRIERIIGIIFVRQIFCILKDCSRDLLSLKFTIYTISFERIITIQITIENRSALIPKHFIYSFIQLMATRSIKYLKRVNR